MDRRVVELTGRRFAGRRISVSEVALIRRTAATFPALSRRELGHTVCEHLGWRTPNGGNRIQSALGLLERMDELGLVTLPAKDASKVRTSQRAIRWTEASAAPPQPIEIPLSGLMPLEAATVESASEIRLWNELVDRHHYLRYRRPMGPHLRYFILDAQARELGCVMFSYASVSLGVRDAWIGWPHGEYQAHLDRIIQNNRFLILPWVKVRNLASKALSMVLRRVADDWRARHGYRPALVETYVDPSRFTGACYRAANFRCLGRTAGGSGKGAKAVYVYPLAKDFRQALLGEAS